MGHAGRGAVEEHGAEHRRGMQLLTSKQDAAPSARSRGHTSVGRDRLDEGVVHQEVEVGPEIRRAPVSERDALAIAAREPAAGDELRGGALGDRLIVGLRGRDAPGGAEREERGRS